MSFKAPPVEPGHFLFGCSSASRWLDCPRSLTRLHQAPRRPSGKAAVAGSIGHEVFERGVKGGDPTLTDIERDDLDLLDFPPVKMQKVVIDALKMLDDLLRQHKLTSLSAEKIVTPGKLIGEPRWAGTADIIASSRRSGVLLVADLKTGRVPVKATDNAQMFSYAAGALADLNWRPEKIIVAVLQPTVTRAPLVSETTPAEIERFVARAKVAVEAILAGDDNANPTKDNCRWCDCRAICESAF